jgi:CBS domain-containing protein
MNRLRLTCESARRRRRRQPEPPGHQYSYGSGGFATVREDEERAGEETERSHPRAQERALDPGLSEIARFLGLRAPFDTLAPEELGEVAQGTEIEFYPSGAVILSEDGGPVTFLRVIHSGAVDIVHDDQLLDLLEPGDTFGHAAMMSGLPPGFEARAAEDTLCYRLPAGVARPLLERARSRELAVGTGGPGYQPVAKLIRSPTVRCGPDESIGDAARRMTEAGANAAVVELPGGDIGILTDRDLRTRVLAAGVPASAPVKMVMTVPVFTVAPGRLGGEVLFELLEHGIRHAPVLSERGQLIGVVEDADLFAVHPRSWFGLRRSIARAQDLESLAAAARVLPELVVDLHSSNLRALDLARVLSALVDALTIRVLEFAGPPEPRRDDGLVWVALGSQARRELTPASVPRGAVVFSDAPPAGWLESVSAGLDRCGLTAEVTARSGEEWIDSGDRDELGLTVLVERRPLWGIPREPLPVVEGPVRTHILRALARRALASSPPTGFDGDWVLEHDGARSERLDIRRAAVIPIVELARWAGAAVGATEGSTPERLAAAAHGGVISTADARTLADAFGLALELRIGHQMEQLAAGEKPDDRIDPAEMSQLTRDHLRDVFRAVAGVQRTLRE